MANIKADDIFLFVQVVEAGSFSKVAQQQEITNSVVSKRISRLEEALNMQLMYRSTRKLSLTDGGETLYQKAKLAKNALQEAQDAVTGYSDTLSGKIKLTAPAVSSRLILNQAIAEFCKAHPEISIELSVDDRVVDLLDEGFDLAIRTGVLEDSSLMARRLVDSNWVIVATAEYIRKNSIPQNTTQLEYHNCLLYKHETSGPAAWRFANSTEEYVVQVNGSFCSGDLNALRQAALADLGLAYLPYALVHEDIENGDLVEVLKEYTAKKVGIYAVYPRMRQPDKKLRMLIEHFREAYQSKASYFN
ncbi:MAG: LysR family transcriptional regulator [Glaciecola sp.]|jgi:DNA-binding transcriptional LysR family regulator